MYASKMPESKKQLTRISEGFDANDINDSESSIHEGSI